MTHATKRTRPAGSGGAGGRSKGLRVIARSDAGIAVLVAARDKAPTQAATNATWAWSVRRFCRVLIWALPAYAVLFGVSTFGRAEGGPTPYLLDGYLLPVIGWAGGLWLGVMALVALAGLLAAARTRGKAVAGLVVGSAGAALMLAFAAMTPETSVFDARAVALTGGALYSLGWLLAGLAVLRSGLFTHTDGTLLMLAAPMLGVGGLLVGPLQTVGALLALAASIGVSVAAGRLVPVIGHGGAGPADPPAAGHGARQGRTPAR